MLLFEWHCVCGKGGGGHLDDNMLPHNSIYRPRNFMNHHKLIIHIQLDVPLVVYTCMQTVLC